MRATSSSSVSRTSSAGAAGAGGGGIRSGGLSSSRTGSSSSSSTTAASSSAAAGRGRGAPLASRTAAGAAKGGAAAAQDSAPPAPKLHPKPSDRLIQKTADPFAPKNKHKTNFGVVYSAGGIPATINHGSIKNKLQWKTSPDRLDYNPLLITCSEGLAESEFPFNFVSRTAFKEMLEAEGGGEKAIPLVARIVPNIRTALMHADAEVFEAALEALISLSNAVGPALNEHLHTLLTQVNRRVGNKSKIASCLEALEMNGGGDALRMIKAKVPTYTSLG